MDFSELGRFSQPFSAFLDLEVFTVLLAGADPPVSDKLPVFLSCLGKLESNNGNSEQEGQVDLHKPPTHPQNMRFPQGARLKMSENIPQAAPRVCVSLQELVLPGIQNGILPEKLRIPWGFRGTTASGGICSSYLTQYNVQAFSAE